MNVLKAKMMVVALSISLAVPAMSQHRERQQQMPQYDLPQT
jgi:uncharacterized membrane protein SirB2